MWSPLRPRLLVALIVCSHALAVGSVCAQAQDAAGSEPAEYGDVIGQAIREYNLGNWEEAAALFDRAHRLSPNARTLRGMGMTAFEARRYVDALGHLEASLRDPRRALTDAQRLEVGQLIDRCETFVSTVQVGISPPDAVVRLDGRRAQLDEHGQLRVDPGEHELSVTAAGYRPEVRHIRAVSSRRIDLEIRLVDQTPSGAAHLAVGSEQQTGARHDAVPGTNRRLWPWAYSSAALAAAAAAGAGGALAIRNAAAREWNDDSVCLRDGLTREQNCSDSQDRADKATWAAVGLAAGAGALGVTALVLFLIHPDASDSASICGAGPGDVGVSCQHRF